MQPFASRCFSADFDYTPRGILDRTHLRFFTRRSARRFLRENNFEVIGEKSTIMPFELVFRLAPDGFMARALNRSLALFTAVLPNLLGYQLLFVVRPTAPAKLERLARAA